MPRGTVTPTDLTINGGATQAGTNIDTANGLLVRAARASKLMLRITNTGGTAGSVHVLPGDNPPAFRAGLGTLDIALAATTGVAVVLLESARFMQSDGDIYLNFDSSLVGVVQAFALPSEF